MRRRGYTLLEIVLVVGLLALLSAIGLLGMQKAHTAGTARGLSTAVAAELRLARERAIAQGSPTAVVFPAAVSRSLFVLEGETDPRVTRTVNLEGDYPRGAITVATYPGPSFTQNVFMPGSKSGEWEARMNDWLPDRFKNDFVFMFTPNGSVVTNDLPSADGSYRLVVGMGAVVTRGAVGGNGHVDGNDGVYFELRSAGEAYTVAVSQGGAVEAGKGLLGYQGSGVDLQSTATSAVSQAPRPPNGFTEQQPDIFFIRVTPPAEDLEGEDVHVLNHGEYLTLEVFARSGDGRQLFTGWDDDPVTKGGALAFKGKFSIPEADLERMDFLPQHDVYEDGRPLEEDVWRSVWTWTPPATAEPGDRYQLTVQVTDSTRTKNAALPSRPVLPLEAEVSPPGEVVFESNRTGRWHLYSSWANGKRVSRLTSGPHDYRCASATADGKLICYERDNSEVWVMHVDGTGQAKVADGQCPTVSPIGNAVAFLRGNDVVVKRIDNGAGAEVSMLSTRTSVVGAPNPSNRMAFSPNGSVVYYTSPSGDGVASALLTFSGSGISMTPGPVVAPVPNIASSAQVGGIYSSHGGDVFYHADQNDPYLGRAYPGLIPYRKSVGQNETFPAISPMEDVLLFCEQRAGVYQVLRVDKAQWTSNGAGEPITAAGENLRPAWIRQSF